MKFPATVDGLVLTFDSRWKARGRTVPKKITVTEKHGTFDEIVAEAVTVRSSPFAVVDFDGRVRVVSAGGSGAIWTVSPSTLVQDEAVRILSAAMTEAFDIKPAVKKKAAARKVVATRLDDVDVESRVRWGDDALGSNPF
jgi:hypothetical protein